MMIGESPPGRRSNCCRINIPVTDVNQDMRSTNLNDMMELMATHRVLELGRRTCVRKYELRPDRSTDRYGFTATESNFVHHNIDPLVRLLCTRCEITSTVMAMFFRIAMSSSCSKGVQISAMMRKCG